MAARYGVGQILPLSKNLSKLLQVGAIGYDQWQITENGGTFALTGPLGNTIILPANTYFPLFRELDFDSGTVVCWASTQWRG
jgi:hypothetical protein